MDRKLINIPLGELMDKFGAGSHIPGSGSAAALLAMTSAQMVTTVIELTKDKPAYAKHQPHLLEISELIEKDYYPALIELFQRDSDEFHKVIALRRQRDAEVDPAAKKAIKSTLEKAMRTATEIPMKIAELALDLGGFALEAFDNGFKAVRGDSGVGLNAAISAVSGCLHIINLNLTSLAPGEWMEEIVWRKNLVVRQYKELLQKDADRHNVQEAEIDKHLSDVFEQAMNEFREGDRAKVIQNEDNLEELVRDLQNKIWIHRKKIWTKDIPDNHLLSLKPEVVLESVLGYQYMELDSLGQHETGGEHFEVAGIIDKSQKTVRVSKQFSDESIRFTAAHELAHAILHDKVILHRDKSIDGYATTNRTRDEWQADKFAALFLMPETLVRQAFEFAFQLKMFEINTANTIAIKGGNVISFREKCRNLRGLAREIASAKIFDGRAINPLAKAFGVSVETMAIRLEELGLVKF